jgi:hypothetical protein
VNQQQPGGKWFFSGTYYFDVGTSGNVVISDNDDAGWVIADAIWFDDAPISHGPTGVERTPMQIACLRWYDAIQTDFAISVGDEPGAMAFDGANI